MLYNLMDVLLASIRKTDLNKLYTIFCSPMEEAMRSKPVYLKNDCPFKFWQANPNTCSTRARIFDFW